MTQAWEVEMEKCSAANNTQKLKCWTLATGVGKTACQNSLHATHILSLIFNGTYKDIYYFEIYNAFIMYFRTQK